VCSSSQTIDVPRLQTVIGRSAASIVILWLSASWLTATLVGCSPGNTCENNNLSLGPVDPIITVANASTGQQICDAIVIASCDGADGGMSLAAAPEFGLDGSAQGCEYGVPHPYGDGSVSYVGQLESPCSLEVSKAGFHSQTVPHVAPNGGGCTAGKQQVVQVELQPN
jgi:hypothetical protein